MSARKRLVLQITGEKLDYYSCADEDAVAVPQVADGLSGDEILALASEGQLHSVNGGISMDWLMKVLMGGWLPEGKRTQMVAAATALGALFTAIVQWGSGDMSFTALLQLIADKWEIFALAFGGYFVAEKMDRKVEEVKAEVKK